MKNTIIFDFDGTIADSYQLGIELYNYAAKITGAPLLSAQQAKELKKFSARKIVKEYVSGWRLPLIALLMEMKMMKIVDKLKPFEGIKEMLKELKDQDYELYILSSNRAKLIQKFLDLNNFNFFTQVISSKGIFSKAGSLKKLISRKNLELHKIIYVGDELRDVEACNEVNLKIISVSWGLNDKEVLEKANPNFVVDTSKQLLTKIQDNLN